MAKIAAKGTIVKVGAAPTPTTALPQIKEIGLVGGEREMIDVTTQDSTVTKETIPNPLRNLRAIELTLVYDPANSVHEAIRAAADAATLQYVTLVLPDAGAAQWAFSGYFTNFSMPTIGLDGALEVTCRFDAIAAETFTQ